MICKERRKRFACKCWKAGFRSLPAVPDLSASLALAAEAAIDWGVGEVMQVGLWEFVLACAALSVPVCASHLPAACMVPCLSQVQLSPSACASLAKHRPEDRKRAGSGATALVYASSARLAG